MDRINRRDWAMIAQAYGLWFQQLVYSGWEPALLTFMFEHLYGPRAAVAQEMGDTVEVTYATLVNRMFRHPKRVALDDLPLWVGCPDYPILKREGGRLEDMIRNDGRHIHVVAMTPPGTRLGCSLVDHIDDNQVHYSGSNRRLSRLHAVQIRSRIEFVADYALKGAKSSRVGTDGVFILPRLLSELPAKDPD